MRILYAAIILAAAFCAGYVNADTAPMRTTTLSEAQIRSIVREEIARSKESAALKKLQSDVENLQLIDTGDDK